MLKTKVERLRLKEYMDGEHGGLELAQTRCEEMVKHMRFEKLLYVAADDTWTGKGIEEKKQKLQNESREELEKTAATRLLMRVYASLQRLAQEPSWEEIQEQRKEFFENDEVGRLCIHKARCQYCYSVFYAVNPLSRYCHNDCKREAFIERRRKKKNFEGWLLTCRYCKEMFVSYRKDSRFCSPSHRVLACSARKRQDPELLDNEKAKFPTWLV